LSILLMTLDHRQHHLQAVRDSLSVVLYPLQFLANLPRTGGEWFAEGLATREDLQEENTSLRTQQLLLSAELQKLEAIQAENMRLRELLDSSLRVRERVLIAEIMSIDLEPFSRQIVINKGKRHDVYEGQPILDAGGVMGQVIQVNHFTSIAMLISDPSHAIPVAVNRNGLRGIAVGTGTSNILELPHIPNNADIDVGDLLVTSGLGGRFPPGYPVARVATIEQDPSQPFARIFAEPSANLDRTREVLLVWTRAPEQHPEADKAGENDEPDCVETDDQTCPPVDEDEATSETNG
jgi:rod shape-determining protein MreC